MWVLARMVTTAFALGLIPVLAFAARDYVAPEGVTLASEEEIRSRFIENTLTGSEWGKNWWEYYEEDGKIKGLWDRERYRGKWSIDGPVMCFDYAGTGYDGCWTMTFEGNIVNWYNLDGSPDGQEDLLPGNKKSL